MDRFLSLCGTVLKSIDLKSEVLNLALGLAQASRKAALSIARLVQT